MHKSTFPLPGDSVEVAGIDTVDIDVADVAGGTVVVDVRTGIVVVAEAIWDGTIEKHFYFVNTHDYRISN